jgi:hypothetical protein
MNKERVIRFTFLCNDHERTLITALAEYLNRSQSDAIRFLIEAAAQELKIDLDNAHMGNLQSKGVTNDSFVKAIL